MTIGSLVLAAPAARAQDTSPVRSCTAADTTLGSPTAAQQRAPLLSFITSRGLHFVRTGTRRQNSSGLAIHATWPKDSTARYAAVQLDAMMPTRALSQAGIERDTLTISIDDGLPRALGVPTPASVISERVPDRIPVSARLYESDLRDVALARSVVVRYAGRTMRFSRSDLASSNALYRVMLCANAS
jgi:hypothetical protein